MLTADLITARRRGDELKLTPLDKRVRPRALELAELFVSIARDHVGRTREEYEEACGAVQIAPFEQRLADGLRKLVEDRCEFDADEALDPPSLRRELFARAAVARRQTETGARLDRARVLEETSAAVGLTPSALEAALFADLKSAHVLRSLRAVSAQSLVDGYDLAQSQAVLLRAVRVIVEVQCAVPGAYRALFHKLKFLRLLHRIEPRAEGGYRLEIDGPLSLFESATRYGLALALALPAIVECDRFRLEAELRWGKERAPLRFVLEGRDSTDGLDGGSAPGEVAAPHISDEVRALLEGLLALDSPWKISIASDILDVPGEGVCVPDLVFERKRAKVPSGAPDAKPPRSKRGDEPARRVYLEVMGYWSRDAVWRRVELVQGGLAAPVLFCVGQQLRVGEAALGDDLPGAILVYKTRLSPRTVLARIEELASRGAASPAPNRGPR